jgi:ATP/maltotriose-dependent transcriptional regulator MalT
MAMLQEALGLSEDVLEKDGARSVLSGRELEILLLAARGMSNRQIASQLTAHHGRYGETPPGEQLP